jgi:ectoine hydroxylase-related dioxygenase (phytanoyl-CoA dioxygenase family)
MQTSSIPTSSYGILEQRETVDDIDAAAEEITCLGYAVINSGYSEREIQDFKRLFDETHRRYLELYGADRLKEIDEHNGIRLPLTLDPAFIDLAANERVLRLVEKLVRNKFILNQQNGVVNPAASARYNQGAWHRDLPYQHFVSSRPLAINALYCIDDFTSDNGATFVVPASHKQESFPSADFISAHAKQISAPAGSFIVLDCMIFHRGGENRTAAARRGVNHVYTAAFIKQQIDIPMALGDKPLRPEISELLGYRYKMPRTVAEFLSSRRR